MGSRAVRLAGFVGLDKATGLDLCKVLLDNRKCRVGLAVYNRFADPWILWEFSDTSYILASMPSSSMAC